MEDFGYSDQCFMQWKKSEACKKKNGVVTFDGGITIIYVFFFYCRLIDWYAWPSWVKDIKQITYLKDVLNLDALN